MAASENERNMIDAVKTGDMDQVRSLLASDPALANARADSGESAVLLAAYYGHGSIVAELLARDVELTVFEAAAVGNLERVVSLCTAQPALINQFSPDGFTPLGLAAFFGRAGVVDYLLAHGAQVNVAAHNPLQVMPLHSAAASQQLAIAKALLDHGADVNAPQQEGFTPLHSAAQNGQIEMIQLLFAHGANANARTTAGETPVETALKASQAAAAELIRQHGGA